MPASSIWSGSIRGGRRIRARSSIPTAIGNSSMKVIAVDRAALKKKYRALTTIDAALAAIVAADKKRGVDTTIVDIRTKTAAEAKKAIDEIDKSSPDYIALIGGPDVIP